MEGKPEEHAENISQDHLHYYVRANAARRWSTLRTTTGKNHYAGGRTKGGFTALRWTG